VCDIVRDNTQDFEKIEVRWEVMKSLLDSSPELWNRAEEYVVIKRHEALIKCSNPNEPEIEKLLRQILMECKQERLK
jgi:hypothetical protein